MAEIHDDAFDEDDWEPDGGPSRLSTPIAEQDRYLLSRYAEFRRTADAIVRQWRKRPEVAAVSLIGSVARLPWKEAPRFGSYRRKGIEVWHECKDLDLAVWLDHLEKLDDLRRAKNRALGVLQKQPSGGPASHQVDIFVIEPGTDRYLGRLCEFNACPKHKPECEIAGCGTVAFLQQHENFEWWPETLSDDRAVRLYNRANGQTVQASDLPLPE